ncbi:MAG: RsmE family RNA methyltransferase [Planctomycetia bacterium]|nr:RsmE family RNA methyltransferase [Planctomycetia bacterium]
MIRNDRHHPCDMTDRYFVEPAISGDTAVLAGPEAHHLTHVKRARPGARVTLFDGSGAEFPAEVRTIGRGEVVLSVLGRDEIDRESPIELTLAVSLPKGDRQRWLVEKCTELGVSGIVPLITTRSVVQPGPQAAKRLARAVIEASKQCGRNRLLAIRDAQGWADFVASPVACDRFNTLRLVAHPAATTTPMDLLGAGLPDRVLLAVGPEGGFTPEEVELALAAGWRAIDLGPRILRIETAAVLLSGLVTLSGSSGRPSR